MSTYLYHRYMLRLDMCYMGTIHPNKLKQFFFTGSNMIEKDMTKIK